MAFDTLATSNPSTAMSTAAYSPNVIHRVMFAAPEYEHNQIRLWPTQLHHRTLSFTQVRPHRHTP